MSILSHLVAFNRRRLKVLKGMSSHATELISPCQIFSYKYMYMAVLLQTTFRPFTKYDFS